MDKTTDLDGPWGGVNKWEVSHPPSSATCQQHHHPLLVTNGHQATPKTEKKIACHPLPAKDLALYFLIKILPVLIQRTCKQPTWGIDIPPDASDCPGFFKTGVKPTEFCTMCLSSLQLCGLMSFLGRVLRGLGTMLLVPCHKLLVTYIYGNLNGR